jgi:Uma2 family endonuclease
MRVEKRLLTAEELLYLPDNGRRQELVEGELFEMPPAGGMLGGVAMTIGMFLASYVMGNRLGHVFAAETGFILARDPDTVRAPDAAFVSYDKLPQGELPLGYLEMCPDLAVEVTSPNDSAREVQEKTDSWLAAGTAEVWVVSPRQQTVTVHRLGGPPTVIDYSGTLAGGDLLPGFEVSVEQLFA